MQITIPKNLVPLMQEAFDEARAALIKTAEAREEEDPVGYQDMVDQINARTLEEYILDILKGNAMSIQNTKIQKEMRVELNRRLKQLQKDLQAEEAAE